MAPFCGDAPISAPARTSRVTLNGAIPPRRRLTVPRSSPASQTDGVTCAPKYLHARKRRLLTAPLKRSQWQTYLRHLDDREIACGTMAMPDRDFSASSSRDGYLPMSSVTESEAACASSAMTSLKAFMALLGFFVF